MTTPPAPDFRRLFESAPGGYLVLLPDAPAFTIVAASEQYLQATMASRERLIGRPLFEGMPEANPGNEDRTGESNLRRSLETVVETRAAHAMPVQRYDIVRPDGGWDERWWAPLNVPVFDDDGRLAWIIHHVEDVTGRQRAERRAESHLLAERDARARLVDILESVRDAFFAVDAGWRLTYVNGGAERYWGRSRDGLLGRTFWEAFPAALDAEASRPLELAMRERASVSWEAPSPQRGTWVHVRAYPSPDGGLAVFFEDVEARKRTEEALRRSEERYALAARATSNAIWDWDLTTNRLEWNVGVEEVFGHAQARVDASVTWWYENIHPDDRDRVVTGIHGVIDGADGGHAWRDEYRFRRADGAFAVVVDRGYVARGTDGRATRMIGAMTDVTAERAAAAERERLLEQTRRLQALTEALAGARTIADVARIVIDEMLAALGARTGAMAVLDRDAMDLVLAGHIGFPPEVAARVERQPLGSDGPVPLCFRTASPVWVASRAGPDGFDARFPALVTVWDRLGINSAAYVPLEAAGETVGVISFAWVEERDFDERARGFLMSLGQQAAVAVERARLFEAEREARREAEAANRAKSEFLAVMSHELRTPLNAIAGYAELMELGIRGPVTPQQLDDLRRIQNSQRHLLGLINEVLNYARLETGAVHFELDDVRLCDTLAAAEGLIAPQARARGLVLDVRECEAAMVVRADGDKVRQVLVNLLSNAVKFTEPGGRIEVWCEPAGERLSVRVRDTGIGIPADRLDDIFEPFVQVRAGLTRTAEGTGLGLAISRDLARGMGGDLTAESTLGAGSTFTLALPRMS